MAVIGVVWGVRNVHDDSLFGWLMRVGFGCREKREWENEGSCCTEGRVFVAG